MKFTKVHCSWLNVCVILTNHSDWWSIFQEHPSTGISLAFYFTWSTCSISLFRPVLSKGGKIRRVRWSLIDHSGLSSLWWTFDRFTPSNSGRSGPFTTFAQKIVSGLSLFFTYLLWLYVLKNNLQRKSNQISTQIIFFFWVPQEIYCYWTKLGATVPQTLTHILIARFLVLNVFKNLLENISRPLTVGWHGHICMFSLQLNVTARCWSSRGEILFSSTWSGTRRRTNASSPCAAWSSRLSLKRNFSRLPWSTDSKEPASQSFHNNLVCQKNHLRFTIFDFP